MAGLPTLQEMEEWIEQALQDNVPKNLQELPFKISETIVTYSEAVYNELTKYGSPVNLPSLQQIEDHMPSNPFAKCPVAPLPPPPPPRGILGRSVDCAHAHRRAFAIAGGVAVLGLGTTAAYQRGFLWLPLLGKRDQKFIQAANKRKMRTPEIRNGVRKEAVVVLGADTPLGRALALHLASVGFIVIASVSSSAAVSSFNSIIAPSSRGYIKTLVFETSDVASSLNKFIRSVDEVLKLRFPLLSAGDPYASPGEEVSLVGVVNALSYLAPANDISQKTSTAFQCNPAELAESMEKHVVAALCALSSLQPLLTSPSARGSLRASEANVRTAGAQSPSAATAITLLSSPSSHTSLPGADRESVIAQAAAAGMEVIRREAEVRSSTTSLSSASVHARRSLRVTTVEIDEGTPWGYAARRIPSSGEAETTASSTSSIGGGSTASVAPAPARPAYMRKASSTLTWPTRDSSTQLVLSKVTSLLLTPDATARLKATYRVYLPTEKETSYWGQAQALWNRGTQRLMRVIPTSWVDVLLSLRRHVSMRRAGLIGQGPRGTRTASQGSSSNAQTSSGNLSKSATSQAGGARRAGGSASASSLAPPPTASSRRGYYYPSNSNSGSAPTSGPPSLPDSNSGESTSFHGDTEDGMVSSGVLDSHSEPEGEGGAGSRGGRAVGGGVSRSNATIGVGFEHVGAAEGPWMGPDEPQSGSELLHSQAHADDEVERDEEHEHDRDHEQHLEHEHEHEHGEEEGDQGEGSSFVGESWVALGESSRRERGE
ncbi:hypothetical protein BCV69DRAFT_283542 [Microstroma glucosiphilum]|uniref:Uncharacterized protein n=1 Tax=Pseudomicrostroma glucosiphilum TaxID=1684307 RepID=A0A316U6D3_9BASI|nr:hypothetical protein BCV69DRAFT_283542 [Pseudomicrostroma glucosiphilum]PWN20021.1 hypothetical protein BCV69DRAFT_283542 [Pseudomicrostroma glucosiphilum]